MNNLTLWQISWAIGAVVVLIVAVLLLIIIAAARSIDRRANEIWNVGKQIAANTVSIWMLQKTNAVAGEILATAKAIAGGAAAIDAKLSELARGGR
jgi:HAMP domain-containing protein